MKYGIKNETYIYAYYRKKSKSGKPQKRPGACKLFVQPSITNSFFRLPIAIDIHLGVLLFIIYLIITILYCYRLFKIYYLNTFFFSFRLSSTGNQNEYRVHRIGGPVETVVGQAISGRRGPAGQYPRVC